MAQHPQHPHQPRTRTLHLHPSWVPIIPIIAWFITLWVLLGVWLHDGRPHLPSMEESIPYISDIGAWYLKPLFIVGSIITGVGFFATLVVDGLLRRAGILERTGRRRVRWLSYASIVSAFIGAIGLIFLSGFDTLRFPNDHDAFLTVFMVGVILSAIFTILEYAFLLRSPAVHRTRLLTASFYGKIVVFVVELALAIAFGITLTTGVYNSGAILEWVVAFVFEFYLVTFWMDLHPANAVLHEREDGEVEAKMIDPAMSTSTAAGRSGASRGAGRSTVGQPLAAPPPAANGTAVTGGERKPVPGMPQPAVAPGFGRAPAAAAAPGATA